MGLNGNDVVIAAAARTPMGGFQGDFSSLTAPELGSVAISAVLKRTGLDASEVDEVLMGNVLSAGIGQAPARQAALGAGIGESTPCTTISKVCGSGMKAVMVAFDQIKAESCEIVVAGGMESMTGAPYLLEKARGGLRIGHSEVKDHMFLDGLEDAYTGRAMGEFAQETANARNISREEMDVFAIESMQKLVDKARWNVEDVDLFEINEAFAMVTMMAMDALGLPHDKVNVNGGACALGHPLGASGARILVTLLYALKQREKTRGVASLCIGGGEATSIAVEMLGRKTWI